VEGHTNRAVESYAAASAAEEQASGGGIVSQPHAHAVVCGHSAQSVAAGLFPALGCQVQHLAQMLLQRLIPLRAHDQLFKLPDCIDSQPS